MNQQRYRDELVAYQALCGPKVAELLGAENVDRCYQAMLREYDEFAPRLPVLEGSGNRRQFYHNAPFLLSLYRTLLGEFNLDREEALDLLGQITRYKVRKDWEKGHGATKFLYGMLSRSAFIRKLGKRQLTYKDEAYGWAAEFPESDATLAFDMTRCGLVDWFGDQGVPEIAPIACEGDYIVAEYMTGLELVRTKTIAAGDEICDFRYVRKEA